MSSNLENDGLIGLQNAMVIDDDNYAKNPYDDVGIPSSPLSRLDSFTATFAPECDNNGDDDDDDIGLVIAESSSMINLDAHLTHTEVMFGVPEVDDFGLMVERVIFDNNDDDEDDDDDDNDTDINNDDDNDDDDDNADDEDSDDDDVNDDDGLYNINGICELEMKRMQNVARNNARLASLGLLGRMLSIATPPSDHPNRKKCVNTRLDMLT